MPNEFITLPSWVEASTTFQEEEGPAFLVDKENREQVLNLERLNQALINVTSKYDYTGGVFLKKIKQQTDTSTSRRKTTHPQQIKVHAWFGGEKVYSLDEATDIAAFFDETLRIIRDPEDQAEAKKILEEMLESIKKYDAMHSLLFSHDFEEIVDEDNSIRQTEKLHTRAWIMLHNPEEYDVEDDAEKPENSTSVLAAGKFSKARFVQSPENGEIYILLVDESKRTDKKERSQKIAMECLKRMDQFLGHAMIGDKDYTITPYVGESLFEFIMVDNDREKLYQDCQDDIQQLNAFAIMAHSASYDLGLIHDQGIVHCDIKPENGGFDKRWYVKWFDFGLSELADEGRTEAASPYSKGTPQYAAPELIKQKKPPYIYTQAGDVYALGKVLMLMMPNAMVKRKYILHDDSFYVAYPIKLKENFAFNDPDIQDALIKVIGLINLCGNLDPTQRPTAGQLSEAFYQLRGFLKEKRTLAAITNPESGAIPNSYLPRSQSEPKTPLSEQAQEAVSVKGTKSFQHKSQ